MIKLMRVDHRLLHGQVAFSWTSTLSADCILIANDDVVCNELRKMSIKLAKPNGVKLVIKSIDESVEAINSGITDKYKLLIVCESIIDAKKLIDRCSSITSLNLGGTKSDNQKRSISKAVSVSKEEEKLLREMIQKDIKIEIQMVPNEHKIDVKSVL